MRTIFFAKQQELIVTTLSHREQSQLGEIGVYDLRSNAFCNCHNTRVKRIDTWCVVHIFVSTTIFCRDAT